MDEKRRFITFTGGLIFLLLAINYSPLRAGEAGILPIEADDTLGEMRNKIDHNNWRFTVERNRFYELLAERQARRKSFSRRELPGLSEEIGPLARYLGKIELPSRFDWRDYNGHSYIGPIRDQQIPCGSCYSFGSLAAAECTYDWATGRYDGDCADFSESFVMWCLGEYGPYIDYFRGCSDGDPFYVLQALTIQGVCAESDFAYQTDDPGSCTHWSDPRTVFQSWHRIPPGDIEAIKTAIVTFGVVVALIDQTPPWNAYSGGVYEDSTTDCVDAEGLSGHCVSLVGWDDYPPEGGEGCWILRNQFGTDWGEDGYMRISYRSAYVPCLTAYLVYRDLAYSHRVLSGSNFDGDLYGSNDIAIFRPSTGMWAVRDLTLFYFGSAGDLPASGDYDGNGTTDIAVYRPASGLWAVRGLTRAYFGTASDQPVPADYNSDGSCDIGVFRKSSGLWALRGLTREYFGGSSDTTSDLPVPLDYDGDKNVDPGVFRQPTGLWAWKGVTRFYFGSGGDRPVAGFDVEAGDAPVAAVFRSGWWAVRNITRFYWGDSSDVPVKIDYIHWPYITETTFTTFRPGTGLWQETEVGRFFFGSPGDIPVAAAKKVNP